jgi:hypothetical protein
VVARPLRAHRADDRGRQAVVEIRRVETVAGPKLFAQIELFEREKARAELAFSRHADAIAVVAERFGDARDHTDVADAVRVLVARGRFGAITAGGAQRIHGVDAVENLLRRNDFLLRPLVVGVERHELDEAESDALVPSECRQVDNFVVVDAAHHDRVDLYRCETRVERGIDSCEHTVQFVSASQREKRLALERVERHVHALQARRNEVVRDLGQLDAVGRERDIDVEWREQGNESRDVRAHERFAAGEANRFKTEALDTNLGDASDLLVRQEFGAGQPVHALGRHAVGAAEVAAIGDRDPQILDAPRERIDQRNGNPA